MSEKPKIFTVTRTPKGTDGVLTVSADFIKENYCAVVNVSDTPCATFDYQLKVPSFWFPINEIADWTYAPFFGTLKVVNEYYKGDRPVLIHCHAGANRSPSIAYAILLAKRYTVEEAEQSLNYKDLSLVFQRNIEGNQIPENVVNFLKTADANPHLSLSWTLGKMNDDYGKWLHKRHHEQKNAIVSVDEKTKAVLLYDAETKRFYVDTTDSKPTITPWVDPEFKSQEWYITPIK